LVKVDAIAVNPVDYKIRQLTEQAAGEKVLGWDACGTVVATGEQVSAFQVGDCVYYAGDLLRAGCHSEYQLVDAELAGHKPKSLDACEAAALPLTAITAWEILFDHLNLKRYSPAERVASDDVLLVMGAAGGVGSILVQLAKVLTGATVIACASRDVSKAWLQSLGVDIVIDHRQNLAEQLAAAGVEYLTHVASLTATEQHFKAYTELLQPFGKIALIDDPTQFDVRLLKMKSLSLHWEFMFARSMHHSKDRIKQHQLLEQVAALVDQGLLKTTLQHVVGELSVDNLEKAHAQLLTATTVGKWALRGFA
jgi:zinc-binding alcohol dehydrogenase family protein